jgi:hypothetical protein
MKDYYSILKSFFSKTNNQERLSQLEKIKNDKTALIKLFNQIKPESKDYSINKNTMKLSELKAQIKEEIINTLKENLSPVMDFQEKIELFIEEYQQEYDVMEDFADLLLSMHNQINREILDEASKEEVENQKELNKELEKTVELSKQAGLKEEEDTYDFDEKEPSKSDLKKDSVATTASKLQKLTAKMRELVKKYKEAEGKEKEKIKDQLKDMTKEKKQLEKAL